MTNPVPRVAAIHDLSGLGHSSLTAVIPILSSMGVQVCPLPTALLSTQTSDFSGYHLKDLTPDMAGIIRHWKELDIHFDAVYSGYLGSSAQIAIVQDFISYFRQPGQLVVVDPVLGDDGKFYSSIDPELLGGMKQLITSADVITPNMTEAALLLDEPYRDRIDKKEIKKWVKGLSDMGPGQVVITSVPLSEKEGSGTSSVAAFDRESGRYWQVKCAYIPAFFPGTGDIFTSVLTGSLLQRDSLPIAMDRAVQFVSLAIRATFGHKLPHREGVLLEKVLNSLQAPVTSSEYQIL